MLRSKAVVGLVVAALMGGCGKSAEYDTSTPQATLDSLQKMIEDGHPEELPRLIEIPARDVTFADGVTEASAIGDVKTKLHDMLAQLWRITLKLKERYPAEFGTETANASGALREFLPLQMVGVATAKILSDPFQFIRDQREHLTVEDMGDGTAAVLYDDEPIMEGAVSMIETDAGWMFLVPVDTLRSSEYFPDTREEWAILASLLLGIENSLKDFEDEIDDGHFKSMRAASERAGMLLGESLVVQGVIYAMMDRDRQTTK
ncbi:MAG: hypothetical protein O2800_00435 [Planctomycetota bacterium]|nr:hypothetical protein [Planctomycetota bacterium]